LKVIMYVGMKRPRLDLQEGIDGNWKCTSCNNINFGTREQCNRCTVPKPSDEVLDKRRMELEEMRATGRKPKPKEGVDGNWGCTSCGNVNWWQREDCRLCNASRPPPEALAARAAELASGAAQPLEPGRPPSKKPTNPNSWLCPTCTLPNVGTRLSCIRCNGPKDGSAQPQGPLGGVNLPGVLGGQKPELSHEDLCNRFFKLEAHVAHLHSSLVPQVYRLSIAMQQIQKVLVQINEEVDARDTVKIEPKEEFDNEATSVPVSESDTAPAKVSDAPVTVKLEPGVPASGRDVPASDLVDVDAARADDAEVPVFIKLEME